MCGIAGFLYFDNRKAELPILKNMVNTILHRGPDGEGFFAEDSVGFAHRRLSILDLSEAAKQPMISASQRFVVTYNGEVYNYKNIRSELESLGYSFRTNSDTEVVLEAFEAWGLSAITKFNGMFAFAIWDRLDKKLYLVRDRYGIKPLYFLKNSHGIFFGSEIKAMLAHPLIKAELNLDGLLEYMTFQNNISGTSLFKGVINLEPGYILELPQNGELSLKKYWDFDFKEDVDICSEEEYEEELSRLFKQAVVRQLISDVPVGCYLSGGIDSGAICAVASQEIKNITSYTVGFDIRSASGLELGMDERATSEYLSYLFKTEHYEMVLKSGDMEKCMNSLMWHLEEPRVGQCYPNFYASKLASKFTKVVLGGTGGDEIFGGYPWRYFRVSESVNKQSFIHSYYNYWQRLLTNQQLKELFKPIKSNIVNCNTSKIFSNVFREYAFDNHWPNAGLNASLYFETKTFLSGLLTVDDKLSMAHSLESRVPFLDNDLVDFSQRLPSKYKFNIAKGNIKFNENIPGLKSNNYYSNTGDGKLILRKMFGRYAPNSVITQPKKGFSAPDSSWYRGESIEYVKEMLFCPNAKIYQYFDKKIMHSLLNEHLSGLENRRLLIWSLLSVEVWLQTFL